MFFSPSCSFRQFTSDELVRELRKKDRNQKDRDERRRGLQPVNILIDLSLKWTDGSHMKSGDIEKTKSK